MAAHLQLLYHVIFSTKGRRPLLQDDQFREGVWAYMAGVAKNLDGFAIQIGGYYDHAHVLVRIPAKVAVSDFVGRLKANTSKYINDRSGTGTKFHWQDGYGAFTVSPSQQHAVVAYISRQMEHHREQSFQNEFLEILKRHEVDYDPKYIWE
jgi:REP element-mobilizing transposase RayT